MKKIVLCISMLFVFAIAKAATVPVPPKGDKLNLEISPYVTPIVTGGTTLTYVYITWNATNNSTKEITIYDSDDENDLGDEVITLDVEKGVAGSHVIATYKYPGTHYVTVVDRKGNTVGTAEYTIEETE